MAKQTAAEKIAEMQAMLAELDAFEDGTGPAPSTTIEEPVLIPHPLDGHEYPYCEECGVQIRRDFKYYGRFGGRLCGSACVEDVLLDAREKLAEALTAATLVLELQDSPMWALLPGVHTVRLSEWAHTIDIPETLQINAEKALTIKVMLDKVEAHEAEIISARRKKRIP